MEVAGWHETVCAFWTFDPRTYQGDYRVVLLKHNKKTLISCLTKRFLEISGKNNNLPDFLYMTLKARQCIADTLAECHSIRGFDEAVSVWLPSDVSWSCSDTDDFPR